MKFEHFALNLPDARAMSRWYVEQFAFQVARQREDAPCTRFPADETGRVVVEFYTNPASSAFWTGQQLVNAFPFETAPRFLLRNRDGHYGAEFVRRVAGLGVEEKVIAPRSPWQNPCVERLIGTLRRECLDYVIILNERHLDAVIRGFLDYYHRHRTHRALERDCPVPRPVEETGQGNIIELPMVGGLHHRYTRQAA